MSRLWSHTTVVFSGYHTNGLITRVANADFAVGAWQNMVIAVWRKRTHADGIAVFRDYIEERARLHNQLALLQIIEDDAAAPDPLARKALARMHVDLASLIYRSAVVYTKPGFSGATARAIITGIAMLNPPKFQHQIFATVPTALEWLYIDPASGEISDALNMLDQAVAALRKLENYAPSSSKPRELGRK